MEGSLFIHFCMMSWRSVLAAMEMSFLASISLSWLTVWYLWVRPG